MKRLITFFTLASLAGILSAQVTIGSGIPPEGGTLLELKDRVVTGAVADSNLGLGIPRVSITTLTPAVNQLAESIGSSSAVTGIWDEKAHIGMVVYNVNGALSSGKGVYVWEGTKWTKLGA